MSDFSAYTGSFDLTGSWSGVFSFPRLHPPTPFTALLDETAGWLLGCTEEKAMVGGPNAGRLLSATLQGRREGRAVTFLKTYDVSTARYDTVSYSGELCADGSELAGQWTAGGWSGEFLMIRAPQSREALVRSVYQFI